MSVSHVTGVLHNKEYLITTHSKHKKMKVYRVLIVNCFYQSSGNIQILNRLSYLLFFVLYLILQASIQTV